MTRDKERKEILVGRHKYKESKEWLAQVEYLEFKQRRGNLVVENEKVQVITELFKKHMQQTQSARPVEYNK